MEPSGVPRAPLWTHQDRGGHANAYVSFGLAPGSINLAGFPLQIDGGRRIMDGNLGPVDSLLKEELLTQVRI